MAKSFVLCTSLCAGAMFLWSGQASAQGDDADPLMDINRSIFAFNRTFDALILRPAAVTYNDYVPDPAKIGVRNFFNNIDDINVVVNDILQLKLKNALQDSGRLVLNSTLGIVGLIDVASDVGLYKNDEDFGQTLGYWGVGAGPYLQVPLLGSFTLRDAFGYPLDRMTNPIWSVDDDWTRRALYSTDAVQTRQAALPVEEMVTGDEYIFLRDAYLQRREYLVNDGVVFDDYDEWDEF